MEDRKKNHIDLASESQSSLLERDPRFYYEPLLNVIPNGDPDPVNFLGKSFNAPLWISSMTGGADEARKINENLARVCGEFKLGMGLGSCRTLLQNDDHFDDFNVRRFLGDQPLYANLGISQIEQAIASNSMDKIHSLVDRLKADGLIIHVNPLQEWIQPEGDIIKVPPINTISDFLEMADYPVIVKEVGQGMGPASLEALLKLPIEAIEFAAFGGTNFSKIELYRTTQDEQMLYAPFYRIGENADRMLESVNKLIAEGLDMKCTQLIISGGIRNFMDGYYLVTKSKLPAIYGQGFHFLQYAKKSYEELANYADMQIRGYRMAEAFLRIREE